MLMMPLPPRPWISVLLYRGALSEPVLADRENAAGVADDLQRHHGVALLEIDASHPVGGATHGTDVGFVEPDGHSAARTQQQLIGPAGLHGIDQGVVLLDARGR